MGMLALVALTSLVTMATGYFTIDGSFAVNENMDVLYHHHDHHRSLSQGSDEDKKLQQAWWNWEFCTNAYQNESFTPMNSLVPKDTVFLAGYPTVKRDNSSETCKSKTITRSATINTGTQTVFFPLLNTIGGTDVDDDWELMICANFTNETLPIRLANAEYWSGVFTNETLTEKLYADIDGKNTTPFYLYDTDEFYFTSCEDNRTYEEYYKLNFPGVLGDTCDEESYQSIGGLDAYPLLGWFGKDTRVWADGESHTYEFGSVTDCITAKYIITAKGEMQVNQGSSGGWTMQFVWTWITGILSIGLLEMIVLVFFFS